MCCCLAAEEEREEDGEEKKRQGEMEKTGQGHSGRERGGTDGVDSVRRKQVRQGIRSQPFH